jgi:fucose permease
MKNKTLPIFLAFLCMGFGDAAGPLTSQLQESYELSNVAASLVTFMGFIMFGILSIPVGLYQDRKGRKHVLQLGLIVAFIGLVLPIISNYSSFALILVSLLFLGTGAATLQVAGNPIMRDVSPEGMYSRNLSFGQFVKGIGTLSTVLIPILAQKIFGYDWRLLFPIYSILLIIALILFLIIAIGLLVGKGMLY